ncbi:MAG: HEPN domain-containing protein [Sulfolobus sp.]
MSQDLFNKLKERARYFFEESRRDALNKAYDISLFHLEQALQLGLKAYLLKTKGTFLKLMTLINYTCNDCLKRLAKNKWYVISILTDAYIGSRYLLRNYTETEYRKSREFMRGALKCLNIIED